MIDSTFIFYYLCIKRFFYNYEIYKVIRLKEEFYSLCLLEQVMFLYLSKRVMESTELRLKIIKILICSTVL